MSEIRYELWQRRPTDDRMGWGPFALLYAGMVDTDPTDPSGALDFLFETFNIRRPHDFHGHSMSVGDMIVLGESTFKVASFGFDAEPTHPSNQPNTVDHYFT